MTSLLSMADNQSLLPLPFPVTHSVLSASALASDVLTEYDLAPILDCRLLAHNLNDTYLVRTGSGPYILRIYQAPRSTGRSWRLPDEILFEIDLLRHLHRRGVPVSVPLARRDGSFIRALEAPEGQRQAVLFTYAPGEPVTPMIQEPALSRLYGRTLAAVHAATEDFESAHARFALDMSFLVDHPLATCLPLLAHRPGDQEFLSDLASRLKARLTELEARGLPLGIVHGDAQGGNAHLDHSGDEQILTFFDFDVCGRGWRAYDLAVFYWGAALGRSRLGWSEAKVRETWDAFIGGYIEQREVTGAELEAVPPFVIARHYWYLGLIAGNWENWSCHEVDDRFFDRELAFLREWAPIASL